MSSQPPKLPSLAEPVTALRRVKIVESGEPLVDFLNLCPELRLDRARFDYRRETLLRANAAEMLCQANDFLLKRGHRLYVVEGWRPPHIQRRMYKSSWVRFKDLHPEWSETKLRRHVNQFTAPMNTRVPPPHSTGGAMDLSLADLDGNLKDMMSPFPWRHWPAFFTNVTGLSDEARRNRDLLAEAMGQTEITNYPSEYWHWSFGDQGWAYRGGHANALYGAITPPNWQPDPRDDVEDPLQWVFEPPKEPETSASG